MYIYIWMWVYIPLSLSIYVYTYMYIHYTWIVIVRRASWNNWISTNSGCLLASTWVSRSRGVVMSWGSVRKQTPVFYFERRYGCTWSPRSKLEYGVIFQNTLKNVARQHVDSWCNFFNMFFFPLIFLVIIFQKGFDSTPFNFTEILFHYLFGEDQTMQMYGKFEWFTLNNVGYDPC